MGKHADMLCPDLVLKFSKTARKIVTDVIYTGCFAKH